MNIYRIAFDYGINPSRWQAILSTVFPSFKWEACEYDPITNTITVTFATPQTPADLGPLVRVELLSTP